MDQSVVFKMFLSQVPSAKMYWATLWYKSFYSKITQYYDTLIVCLLQIYTHIPVCIYNLQKIEV